MNTAQAQVCSAGQTSYCRILNEQTPFYADASGKILRFYLPYSYYAKVVSVGNNFTRIAFMNCTGMPPCIDGYIKTSDLFFCDSLPNVTDCRIELEIATDEILFSDCEKQTPKAVLSANSEAYYYGWNAFEGQIYYYIYSSGYVGYVRKGGFSDSNIPLHPEPIITEPTPPDSQQSSIQQDSTTDNGQVSAQPTIQTFVIICVSIVTICIIYYMSHPQRHATKSAIPDIDEYD